MVTPFSRSIDSNKLLDYDTPLFDEAVYAELKDMIGSDVAQAVLIKYCNATSEDRQSITQCVERCDYQKISEYAHKIKSASAQVGAIRLSKLSQEVETSFSEECDGLDMVFSCLSEYQEVLDDTLKEVEKRILG